MVIAFRGHTSVSFASSVELEVVLSLVPLKESVLKMLFGRKMYFDTQGGS